METGTQVGQGAQRNNTAVFAAIFDNFSSIFTCFGGFHQNIGMTCQKKQGSIQLNRNGYSALYGIPHILKKRLL